MIDSRLNTLAAQLTKMTPQQRQKFAMLHKDDPIAVSMAKYVNDQSKALGDAVAAKNAPAAYQAPPVVDQTIAQMAPPKTPPQPQAGLGALPAPNLQGMPDGGIAGQDEPPPQQPQPFAQGGATSNEVSGPVTDNDASPNLYQTYTAPTYDEQAGRFRDDGNSLDTHSDVRPGGQTYIGHYVNPVSPEGKGYTRFNVSGAGAGRGVMHYDGGGFVDPEGMANLYGDVQGAPSTAPDVMSFLRKPRIPNSGLADSLMQAGGYPGGAGDAYGTPSMEMAPKVGAAQKDLSPVPVPAAPTAGIGAPPQAKPPSPAFDAAFAALTAGPRGSGGGGGRGVGPAVGIPQMPAPIDINAAFQQATANATKDPFANELAKYQQDKIAASDSAVENAKRDNDLLGDIGKDREQRLGQRSAKLDKFENDSKGMALLSAGLAMMAGTSPNAFANIGNGAQVGVQQYQQSQEKLLAARDRLDDAYWQLESTRYGQKQASMKEIRDAENHAAETRADVEQQTIAHLMDTYKMSHEDAKTVLSAAVQQNDAAMQAAAHVQGADIQGRYNLAGHQAIAGAQQADTRMRTLMGLANIEQRNGEMSQLFKGGQLSETAERNAASEIAAMNKARASAMQPPLSPTEMANIRARHHANVPAQYGGIGTPPVQDTAPAFDPSQWTVKPK